MTTGDKHADGWRDVRDELPGEAGTYLVTVDPIGNRPPFVIEATYEGTGGRPKAGCWRSLEGGILNVTHWMPFPEPAQRSKSEQ